MKNPEIAKILYKIAIYLEMQDIQFKPRAYERAARSIEALQEDVSDIYKRGGVKALMEIPGVGENIALKIEELIKTGKLQYYEKLKKEAPVDVENLTAIEGLGPKKIKVLYKKLKVKTVEDLERVAREGKIRNLETFGEKTEENILKGIEFLKKHRGRFYIGEVLPLVLEIEGRLKNLKEVKRVVVAGSVRRRKETVGDADILVISNKPEKVMDFFVSMPEVINVYGKGPTKSMVKLKNGFDVDLRVLEERSFGAGLNYFTGSKDHNVALRQIAKDKGLKLSEYGIFKGKKYVGGRTEEEIYKILGLRYIEPEMRENSGEIEAARKNQLPELIEYGSLKGDLQIQTDWSDGSNSIKEMAVAAREYGLEYIAVTDHTKSLAIAGGLDEKKLLRQMQEIDKLNKQIRGITILKGAEVNIQKDGSLDIRDDILGKMDVVGIAVHSYFNLSKEEQTKRIIRAMENPNVDILFHPTGRIINEREPYDVDIEQIIDAAKSSGTILEINASERLDLKDEHIRLAIKRGCKFVIDSDAHNKLQFHWLELGIAQARRGWAEKKDVINTLPLEKFLKHLK